MSSFSRVIKLARLGEEPRLIPAWDAAGTPDSEAAAAIAGPPEEAAAPEAPVEPPSAAAIQAEAYRIGFEQGLADGRRAAELEQAELLSRLRRLVETARLEHRRVLREAEEQLLVLALAAAERILSRKLEEGDRKLLEDFLTEALGEVVEATHGPSAVLIRVNPQDFEFVRGVLAAAFGGEESPRLLADPRVEAGGCVVETSAAVIDSTPTERLRQVARLFRQAHELEYRP